MDRNAKNKWLVRAAALAIFLLGALAGTLAPRAYSGLLRDRTDADTRRGGFEQMMDSLQLSEEQKPQVRQIFGDTRGQLEALRRESEPRVAEIRRQTDERLRKVLTPEQWQRFEQMKQAVRYRRGRGGEAR
jgi:Spy/CpxP family protein refolding chaperone